MALGGLGLVEAGQAAVVALVQPPVLLGRDPDLVGGLERQPQGADGPGQNRGEGQVELKACGLDQLAGAPGVG
jgi:hypothetical protein